MWTMVVIEHRNRWRLHIADETWKSFCGIPRERLLVRDYVEVRNEKLCRIGEANQILNEVKPYDTCKKCLKKLNSEQNVQASVATGDDSSTDDQNKK